MTNAAVVLCMDASASMTYRGYFEPAKTDAATFAYVMKIGDSIGVIAFGDSASTAYPPSGDDVATISSQAIQDDVSGAIMAMQAAAGTNVSAGLAASQAMLSAAADPKAIVLLSDGEWNLGPNPLGALSALSPVYTVALGPDGGTDTLQQIAAITGGRYNFAPTVFALADVYNEIIVQARVAAVVASRTQLVQPHRDWTLPAAVAEGAAETIFSVSWSDPAVAYTSAMPAGEQIAIAIQTPSGEALTPAPAASGHGFAVFKIRNPQAGLWHVAIRSSASAPLGTCATVFDPRSDIQSEIEAPASAKVGRSVPVSVKIRDADGTAPSDLRVAASVEMPTMNPEDAMRKFRAELDALAPGSDNARMRELQFRRGPGDLLLPYDHIPVEVRTKKDGTAKLAFTPKFKGGHIVRLHITGRMANDKREFSLARRISVWIE